MFKPDCFEKKKIPDFRKISSFFVHFFQNAELIWFLRTFEIEIFALSMVYFSELSDRNEIYHNNAN